MADLDPDHCAQALARLAAIEQELASISTWLAQLGEDDSAIALEHAWEGVAAACWRLEGRRVTSRRADGPQ